MEKTNQNLLALRKKYKYTRQEVEKMTGIKQARIVSIELRGDTVRPTELIALCKLYRVSVEKVVER